jgi:hypothetical protein
VGATVSGIISPLDPPCGTSVINDQPEPCQLFLISIPASGVLTVQVTSPAPGGLTFGFDGSLQWGWRFEVRAVVRAGASHQIAIALHDGRRAASQTFELRTSFEPW